MRRPLVLRAARVARAAALAVALSVGLAGCIAPPADDTRAHDPAPAIAGTLYVFHPSTTADSAPGVEILHDGKLQVRPAPGDELIARNKPSARLAGALLFGEKRLDPKSCEPIAISPDGKYAACLRSDGLGSVTIFALADPAHTQRNTAIHVAVNSRRMAAFVGDTLAVAADDNTCPQFFRTDAHMSYEPRARLFLVDPHGKTQRKDVCIHGVVAGAHRLAYISHDTTEHPLYSFDGQAWNPGLPLTFDGGDHLLVLNQYDQLIDDQGRVVSENVVDALWTR